MTQRKDTKIIRTKLSFAIEGADEFEIALNGVITAYDEFKTAAAHLQECVADLNAIEIKVTNE